MSNRVCRWGILGSANIARKNWKAIRLAENADLIAVASRDRSRAEKFIAECQSDVAFPTTPAACGSYEELLSRPDIDAVYIPLPTGLRKEWVMRAAAAGKHVLSEKPCAVTSAELEEMLKVCAQHRVQFMDGVMFMHSARLNALRQVLDDGESVGELRRISSQFSFFAPAEFYTGNIRVSDSLEPLGCLGDLGWYNIRFSLWVMRYTMPTQVIGRMLAAHGTVPTEFSAELLFPGGVSASFYCSFRTQNHEFASISGTKGYITLDDFVLPFHGPEAAFTRVQNQFRAQGCTFHMGYHPQRFAVAECDSGTPEAQETNMIRTFSQLALTGSIQPHWGEIALKTQQVMDACLQSAHEGGKLISL